MRYNQPFAKGGLDAKGGFLKKVLLSLLCVIASSCEQPSAFNDFNAIMLTAEQGDAQAQYTLGLMYEEGDSVERNNAESYKWYLRSATQGVAQAQYRLGLLYDFGQGVPRNAAEAAKWYKLAAMRDHPEAQYQFGRMHYSGLGGLTADLDKAFEFFQRAAKQGNTNSQHMLGEMYYTGTGVQQSYFHSYVWLTIASVSDEASSSVRATSAKALSTEDLKVAQTYIAKLMEDIEARKAGHS